MWKYISWHDKSIKGTSTNIFVILKSNDDTGNAVCMCSQEISCQAWLVIHWGVQREQWKTSVFIFHLQIVYTAVLSWPRTKLLHWWKNVFAILVMWLKSLSNVFSRLICRCRRKRSFWSCLLKTKAHFWVLIYKHVCAFFPAIIFRQKTRKTQLMDPTFYTTTLVCTVGFEVDLSKLNNIKWKMLNPKLVIILNSEKYYHNSWGKLSAFTWPALHLPKS